MVLIGDAADLNLCGMPLAGNLTLRQAQAPPYTTHCFLCWKARAGRSLDLVFLYSSTADACVSLVLDQGHVALDGT